ncbi:site-specific integrase [Massilia sp. ST3]|uniref:tyrosine-type recombinase/integrase n=1 Tax=Massilia sp. ST3 TaxID=2824903 RepID=UPI001B81FC38|nr:site-specific integrase [Massilia sp. ST3]MBQ5946300.1 site-specific integrase [Massilia sp. ST3]
MREGKAKVLNERELSRVINVVKRKAHAKRNIALLYCSFGLGLRAKEMAALRIKHVLGTEGSLLEEINLVGTMTKGNKQRHAYLTNPKVVNALRDFINDRQKHEGILFTLEAPLFKSQKGSAFSANSLQQLFHRMYSEAKLQGASSHSGRRTFATMLIEKGVDIKAVSTLMGHSSIAMTAQYVEDNPLRLKQICTDIF